MDNAENDLILIPFPDSLGVQLHMHADSVSEVFVDTRSGRRVVIMRDTATLRTLSEDLTVAADLADRLKGA